MTKQVRARVCFELPSDPSEEAAALATMAVAWKAFTDAATSSGLKVWGQSFEMKKSLGPRLGNPRLYAVKSGDAA